MIRKEIDIEPNNCYEDINTLFENNKASIEFEKYIEDIINQYSENRDVNVNIDLKELEDKFSASHIPIHAVDIMEYMEWLREYVVKYAVNVSSPRFLGHMTSALPYYLRSLSKLMVALNQNMVKMETAKSFSFLERQALAMMHRLIYNFDVDFYNKNIQQSQSTLGIMTTGGTTANIIALWCARNTCLGRKEEFMGVEKEGLPRALKYYGYEDAVIIGPTTMHYSFDKAIGILGLGTQNLIRIPVNRQNNKMDLDCLRATMEQCQRDRKCIVAVIGVAGTTEAGAVDPLLEIYHLVKKQHIHFHVDAAWGGPLLFSHKHRSKLIGIDYADTVTIDGHKQLYLPMGCGMVYFKKPEQAQIIEKNAQYVARFQSLDMGKRSLDGSRQASVLYLHTSLNVIGRKGYEFIIDEGIRKTQYISNFINQNECFELILNPEINIILYRYIPIALRKKMVNKGFSQEDNNYLNEMNQQLQKFQRKEGKTFVSRTRTTSTPYGEGVEIVVLRMVISNPLITQEDIHAVFENQVEIARNL
jgi:glutamate decarboxylase